MSQRLNTVDRRFNSDALHKVCHVLVKDAIKVEMLVGSTWSMGGHLAKARLMSHHSALSTLPHERSLLLGVEHILIAQSTSKVLGKIINHLINNFEGGHGELQGGLDFPYWSERFGFFILFCFVRKSIFEAF